LIDEQEYWTCRIVFGLRTGKGIGPRLGVAQRGSAKRPSLGRVESKELLLASKFSSHFGSNDAIPNSHDPKMIRSTKERVSVFISKFK
jgi:hypothetical protein